MPNALYGSATARRMRSGLDFGPERFDQVMRLDDSGWKRELQAHDELFAKLGAKQPQVFAQERTELGARFGGRQATL